MADKEDQAKAADAPNPFALPDLSQMLEQLQVPGVDFGKLADDAQKNIDALQEANRTVAAGWQSLAEKQMEIFQQTMQTWQSAMPAGEDSPAESARKQADLARTAFEQAIANMRELAEIAADSQSQAFEIMRSRFEENMRNALQPPEKD